jgi:hypothetical protein
VDRDVIRNWASVVQTREYAAGPYLRELRELHMEPPEC